MKKILSYINLILLIFLCSSCESLLNPCDHEFSIISETAASCEKTGLIIEECSICGKNKKTKIPKLDHEFTDYVITITPTETSDGLRERNCKNCGHIEKEIIISKSYIDMDIIKEEYEDGTLYLCQTFEEAVMKLNAGILSLSTEIKLKIGFDYEFNELVDRLFASIRVGFDYEAKAELTGNILTFTFKYLDGPKKTTTKVYYTQYNSLNYKLNKNPKQEGFKIDNSIYSKSVYTTEQLYYALERGVKPLPRKNSRADPVYTMMKDILKNIISDDMTDVEKILAIHDYLVMNVTYDEELLQLASSGAYLKDYKGFYLEGVFLEKKAVCEGISKAFTSLCNIEGIPCVSVTGYQTKNPNGLGHAWNKVYVNNAWYIVDVTSDGTIINNSFEVLSYNFFMVTEEEYSKEYTANDFTNIICDTEYNPYQLFKFTHLLDTYDYVITSQDELNKIIKYFVSSSQKNQTIEFVVSFDYGEDILDEIEKAYQANLIFSGFSYIINENKVMLIA